MPKVIKKNDKRLKKEAYWTRLWTALETYNKGLIINCDNVSSKQISLIRQELRSKNAEMLMGKNTLIKAAINRRLKKPEVGDEDYEERKDSWTPLPKVEALLKLFRGNVGIILTNGDLFDIMDIINGHRREAPAKVGSFAQCDVWVRAGSTGLDPKQTAFFQNLNIPTKIVKTQIEIVSDKQVVFEGMKIGSSEAALLDKLNIRPFSYMMTVTNVYENGQIFPASILKITNESILAKF
jgi:large subunit ribosomal protein LP0